MLRKEISKSDVQLSITRFYYSINFSITKKLNHECWMIFETKHYGTETYIEQLYLTHQTCF